MSAPGGPEGPSGLPYDPPIGRAAHSPRELVGRDDELATILDGLLADGSGQVAVAGPPGIGKSALVQAAAAELDREGILVLRGRAAEFERDLPFAVWVDALDAHLELVLDDAPELLADGIGDELAAILPAVAARTAAGDAPRLVDERHRVHGAMRGLLGRLSERQELVVLLDDLHWADDGSIDLVISLLHRPPAGAAGLLLALRPAQSPDRFVAALERAERDGGLSRVALDVLDDASCDQLLGDAIDPALRAHLRRESGGNPFFLEQLARTSDSAAGVPRSVMDAIGEELRALPDDARLALEGAAVAGEPFDPALAAAAAELDRTRIAGAVDELARRDLVRVADDGRRFVTRHPLVRRAVYESSGAGWRLAAHGRVADALRARSAGPSLLAHHVARSATPGDLEAVAVLRDGAATVLDRAPAVAAEWLRTGLELLDGGAASPAQRSALLRPLATALTAIGELEGAREATLDALAGLDPGALDTRVGLVIAGADLEFRLGRHADAARRLETALRDLPPEPSRLRARLLAALAGTGMYRGELAEMAELASQVLTIADALDDPPYRFAAHALAAAAAIFGDDVPAASAAWDRAAAAFDGLTDEDVAEVLGAVNTMALAGMYLERFTAMGEQVRRGLRVAREARQSAMVPVLTLSYAYGAAMIGRLEEARTEIEGAVEAARISGSAFTLSWVLMNASLIEAFSGDLAAAVRTGEEGLELLDQFEGNIVTAQMGIVLAEAMLELGNPERAYEYIVLAGAPEIHTVAGFWRCSCYELLADIELGRGKLGLAQEAVDRAAAQAQMLGLLPLAHGWALRAQASVSIKAGDAQAGLDHALRAQECFDRGESRVEEGRNRIVLARALATLGRKDEAIAQLEQAHRGLEACGAAGFREEAARALRRLGRRPSRGVAGAQGLASLSGREREIADLVADGNTNGEIAATLFLSPKTVETHLRNVFAKLRVSSRLEVATMVDRERRP